MRNLHPSSPERKRHLSMEKRLQIECLYNQNLLRPKKERLSLRRLAAKLGIARSTLSDEIRRGLNPVPNTFKDKDIHDYSASRAQAVVNAGALNKGVPQRYTNHIAAILKELIVKDRLSPNHARSVSRKSSTPSPGASWTTVPPPKPTTPPREHFYTITFCPVFCCN